MNRLHGLRSRLQQLRLWRTAVRWGNAAAVLITVVVAFLAAAFLMDWSLHLAWWLRAIVLIGFGATVSAVIHRWLWPWLSVRESLAEVALVVERAHDIDSDLVAALEFDEDRSLAWGSPRLSAAVVNYVAEFSESLDVYRDFDWQHLPKRAGLAFGSLLLTFGTGVLCPAETHAFWQRFWLGSARYPTRTEMAELTINGQQIPVHHTGTYRLAIPQGQPLELTLKLAGELPDNVMADVRSGDRRERTRWNLTATTAETFQWRSSQLVETLQVRLLAGDAESDPVIIDVVPLPIVELTWTVTPPTYAQSTIVPPASTGSRTVSALQGSRIELLVSGKNKLLRSVSLKLDETIHTLQPTTSDAAATWRLPEGTALDSLSAPLKYQVSAIDQDGLSPQPPLTGEIRLQTDRVPHVAVAVVSRKVLPTATPVLSYGATDDFGLKSLTAQIVVVRMEGEQKTYDQPIWPNAGSPTRPNLRSVRGEYPLPLAAWQLQKGDEVRVTVVAADERGTFPSQVGQSEPLIFEVTDRNGILESLLEIDQQSARQLDEIIERELGIGRTSR
ncbi:hypothetical protein GC163_15850 [bacterium]|nr:hypothetical protein [bacterium]